MNGLERLWGATRVVSQATRRRTGRWAALVPGLRVDEVIVRITEHGEDGRVLRLSQHYSLSEVGARLGEDSNVIQSIVDEIDDQIDEARAKYGEPPTPALSRPRPVVGGPSGGEPGDAGRNGAGVPGGRG